MDHQSSLGSDSNAESNGIVEKLLAAVSKSHIEIIDVVDKSLTTQELKNSNSDINDNDSSVSQPRCSNNELNGENDILNILLESDAGNFFRLYSEHVA